MLASAIVWRGELTGENDGNFYFWWLAVFGVIQILIIATRDYSNQKTVNIGEDLLSFILIAGFFIWLLLIKLGAA